MRDAKPLASPPDASAKARAKDAGRFLGDLDARRLVFVDGAFVPELSDLGELEPGLVVGSLAQALTEGDPVAAARLGKLAPANDAAVALNTALMGDGAVIRVASGATIERPLHLLFVVSDKPAAIFTRSLVTIDHGARVMLIESHEGPVASDYQVNAALELFAGDSAHVDHVKVIGEGAEALHVSTLAAAIGAHARFNTFSFMNGGALVRNQLFLRLDGEGTVAGIRGASLLKDRQHADTTLFADHIARDCQSREMFKSVLDNEAHGVFQGRIIVRRHAQKTDAKMMTQALLLSERAEADNKPELEIFADDVQCGRARRRAQILLDGARHPAGGSRSDADPGVSRRSNRGHRTRRLARGPDRDCRSLAWSARIEPTSCSWRSEVLRWIRQRATPLMT